MTHQCTKMPAGAKLRVSEHGIGTIAVSSAESGHRLEFALYVRYCPWCCKRMEGANGR